MDKRDEALFLAVRKKALGYTAEECVEEFALVDGQMQLVKRKVSIKDVPPDVTAARLLWEGTDDDFERMTDDELEAERQRLIAGIRNSE